MRDPIECARIPTDRQRIPRPAFRRTKALAARTGRTLTAVILWDASVMRDSLVALRKLRDQAGATMFYGHDPAQWETIPRVPTPVL